jgi:hypothetical protein
MRRAWLLTVVALLAVLAAPQGGARTAGSNAAATVDTPAGTLVFTFGTNRLLAIDVASGRRTVRKVTALAACGPQMYVTGGHVIFAGIRRGRTVVYSVPAALDRPPRRLGTAHAFVPSATEGRVWLAGVVCTSSEMVGAREVTVDGRVTRRTDTRLPGDWLAGAVSAGLVLWRSDELSLWDPDSGRAGRPLATRTVLATHGDRLVGCSRRCDRLTIIDTATGRRVALPSGVEFDARFSPDGSLIAATTRGADRRWRIALVDSATGEATTVPGVRTRDYPRLAWSDSSGWLFAQLGGGRVMAYRPGTARAVELPFRAPRRAIAFVAG